MNGKDHLVDLFIHDLNGVLSVVLSSVNSLLNKQEKYGPITEKQQKALNMALRNSNKARSYLNEIIEIYRSDEGLFKKEIFSIREIFRESIIEALEITDLYNADKILHESGHGEFFDGLKEQGIIFNIFGKYESSAFCHDKIKIQQILRNLFTNALKHRRNKITINISGDDDLIISVEDDGSGIPQEKQNSIFTRFFRLKNGNYEMYNADGLGFGLSCVKSIVETMNGAISLESCLDAGTKFTVRIPPLPGALTNNKRI